MKITELKELAEKATPGPWNFKSGDNQINSPKKAVALAAGSSNTEYIAAANPQVLLQLIERVELLSQALAFYASDNSWYRLEDTNSIITDRDLYKVSKGKALYPNQMNGGKSAKETLSKYGSDVELK